MFLRADTEVPLKKESIRKMRSIRIYRKINSFSGRPSHFIGDLSVKEAEEAERVFRKIEGLGVMCSGTVRRTISVPYKKALGCR